MFAAVLLLAACGDAASADSPRSAAVPSLPPITGELNGDPGPPPAASVDISAPPLDLRVTKSMIYAAAIEQHLNPYLAMGLGWWESGWRCLLGWMMPLLRGSMPGRWDGWPDW